MPSHDPASSTATPRLALRGWWVTGIWLGLGLALWRLLLVLFGEVALWDRLPRRALWGATGDFPLVLAASLAAGLAGALFVAFAAAASRRRSAAVVLAALVLWAAFPLRAWLLASPALQQAPLLVPALAGGALLFLPAAFAIRGRSPGHRPRPARAVLAALLLLGAGWGIGRAYAPVLETREIVREVVIGAGGWSTLASGEQAPHVATVTPSIAALAERSDMPALVLPPPSSVELAVEDDEGEVVLQTAVCIGHALADPAREGHADEEERLENVLAAGEHVAVEFEIEVDGEVVFAETMRWETPESAAWLDVPERAVTLPPGSVVRLRTRYAEGSAPLPKPAQAAFARLSLQRVEHRAATLADPSRPNVVFVVMDTERFDRTSLAGYHLDLTPNLARLARRGVTYTQAYSTSSWTWPSTASLLTGLQPDAHGLLDSPRSFLASELETLAELMQAEGLATACISGNPLVVAPKNFDQGFQTFESTVAPDFVDSDVLVPRAIEWIREQAPGRFFLYLHLVDPHVPHDPSPAALELVGGQEPADYPEKGMHALQFAIAHERRYFSEDGRPLAKELLPAAHQRWINDSYDAAVFTGDEWLGVLLDALADLGLAERTVVAYTSDHGEELLDHGMLKHLHSIHAELVRVPLVLAGPGVPSGERAGVPVSNRHLMGTLAHLAGVERAAPEPFHDLARPASVPAEPIWFSTTMGWWNGQDGQALYGVRDGRWALHYAPTGLPWDEDPRAPTVPRGQARLYDLSIDPGEQDDVGEVYRKVRAELLERTKRNLAGQSARAPKLSTQQGDGTARLLELIDYVDGGEDHE